MAKAALADQNIESDEVPMTSSIGRDALKRANNFTDIPDAMFETIANAYEAYNIGEQPFVDIVVDARKRTLTVSDRGVGLDRANGVPRYFALHAKPERRVHGLNMRGYNGTGKVAPFKYAERLELNTVKDGMRNIYFLTKSELQRSIRAEDAPRAQPVVRNHPTTEPNGTTITISGIDRSVDLSAVGIRALKEKIATEHMMWMKNAVIRLNGEIVEPAKIPNVAMEPKKVVSTCGNFEATIYFSKVEMPEELRFVFISAGRVFVARENWGKEGSKFSNFVHVDVRATEDWAQAHFYEQRELFVTEARDLRMRLDHPEGVRLKNFIETEVRSFVKVLEDEEEARRRASMDERRLTLEKELSRIASSLVEAFGGGKQDHGNVERRREDEGGETVSRVNREGNATPSADNENRKASVGIVYDNLGDRSQYRIENGNKIVINLDHPTISAVGNDPSSPLYKLSSLQIVCNAIVEMKSSRHLSQVFGEDGEAHIKDFMAEYAKVVSEIQVKIAESTSVAINECADRMAR